jgi:hypothetical protein
LNGKNILIQNMLVLKSSYNEKESYHIILDHENIRFIDNHSVHLLVEEIFHLLLLTTLDHECLRNKNCINKKLNNQSSISEIINTLGFVWKEWFACVDCNIKNIELSVSYVCNLFVYDQKEFIVPCVDFKVYGVEQDFCMFMCTKRGAQRPLKRSLLFTKNSELSAIPSESLYNLKSY